jgi:hypothetical protein
MAATVEESTPPDIATAMVRVTVGAGVIINRACFIIEGWEAKRAPAALFSAFGPCSPIQMKATLAEALNIFPIFPNEKNIHSLSL